MLIASTVAALLAASPIGFAGAPLAVPGPDSRAALTCHPDATKDVACKHRALKGDAPRAIFGARTPVATAACHPDPRKGSICRHNKIVAENQAREARPALADAE